MKPVATSLIICSLLFVGYFVFESTAKLFGGITISSTLVEKPRKFINVGSVTKLKNGVFTPTYHKSITLDEVAVDDIVEVKTKGNTLVEVLEPIGWRNVTGTVTFVNNKGDVSSAPFSVVVEKSKPVTICYKHYLLKVTAEQTSNSILLAGQNFEPRKRIMASPDVLDESRDREIMDFVLGSVSQVW